MYDLKKRAYISTLGELRELLAELPDDTEILACGSSDAWLHFEKDNSLVSLDYADLDDGTVYLELDDDDDLREQKIESEDNEHSERLSSIEEGWQAFFIGNKLMRTFQVVDDTVDEEDGERFGECWDYELYNVNLTIADSGQLGKQGNTTREDAIKEVLSWNHLEHEKRNYICVTEDLVELCEKCD